MSDISPQREPAPNPSVALFQKAHQRIVALQRLDEQIAAIFSQRRKLQEELREVQFQINDEFERVIKQADAAPKKLLAEMIVPPTGRNGEGRLSERGLLQETEEAV